MASWNDGNNFAESSSRRQLPSWLSNSKENQTESLPVLKFPGTIHYHTTIPDASIACAEIRKNINHRQIILGFDTEWAAPFRKTDITLPPSVIVQLCADYSNCHVIQLSAMLGFPRELKSLIMDTRVIKSGVGVKNDIKKLGKEQQWHEDDIAMVANTSTAELSDLANKVLHTSQRWSLQRLVQHLLKCDLPKEYRIRCGDWTQNPLSQEQITYAALDAYAGFALYEELMSI